jgi:hypothetical protein
MIFPAKYCSAFYVIGLFLFFTLVSCEKYPDPSSKNLINYYYTYYGLNQRTFTDSYLNDSVTLYINGDVNNSPDFEIHFDVTKGGGSVDQGLFFAEMAHSVGTKWKLGNLPGEQILKASIYEKTGRYLGSFNYTSYAFKHHIWQAVTTNPEITISDMVVDTINHLTFISSSNQIYKQGANYFDWTPLVSFQSQWLSSLEIDKNGIIYVAKWNGELIKSTDHGDNWVSCTKPIPSNMNYFDLEITPDGTLWAYTWDKPLRFSKDGGNTWVITNLNGGHQNATICLLSDGTLLLLSISKLFRSEDGGSNWTDLNISEYPMNLYVTKNDEVIILTQDNGFSIKKSVDRGEHFTRVYNVLHYGAGKVGHGFLTKGEVYCILIPGKGILTTLDFQNFNSLWSNSSIYDMFMDHQGTIIATEYNSQKAYYYSNDSF